MRAIKKIFATATTALAILTPISVSAMSEADAREEYKELHSLVQGSQAIKTMYIKTLIDNVYQDLPFTYLDWDAIYEYRSKVFSSIFSDYKSGEEAENETQLTRNGKQTWINYFDDETRPIVGKIIKAQIELNKIEDSNNLTESHIKLNNLVVRIDDVFFTVGFSEVQQASELFFHDSQEFRNTLAYLVTLDNCRWMLKDEDACEDEVSQALGYTIKARTISMIEGLQEEYYIEDVESVIKQIYKMYE